MTCVRVIVHGRVQGVWFRGWCEREAKSRGLNGWVRNRRDGTVEALFEGPDLALTAMIGACREGPPAARVTRLEDYPSDEDPVPGFRQIPTV